MAAEYGADADGGVAAELSQRHGRSAQPESQQVMAVLRAVTDVIRSEGLPLSPTSYFAAVMSALEKPDTQAAPQGGLYEFFSMVMAGLVATTPHMVSATVMALARLTFEFAAAMQNVVSALVPPVLSLLRSKARETVKAVLGFVKVCAMRLPVDLLTPQLGTILEGVLLWAEDSKNKFKLKVLPLQIVEGLAGTAEPRTWLLPLLRRHVRHCRLAFWQQELLPLAVTLGSRSAALTATGGAGAAALALKCRTLELQVRVIVERLARRCGFDEVAAVMPASDTRLLAHIRKEHVKKARRKHASSNSEVRTGGVRPAAAGAAERDDFGRDPSSGKMLIGDEEADEAERGRKRRRRGGHDSDDSDYEDLKHVADLGYALKKAGESKSVRFAEARSAAAGARSVGGRSAGGRSAASGASGGGRSAASGGGRGGAARGGGAGGKGSHSGERFKAKDAAGDVKGKAKVEPYAYWSLDRRMLNRRKGKQAAASSKLASVVAGAKAGAAKGGKARRAAGARHGAGTGADGGAGAGAGGEVTRGGKRQRMEAE
ncbi:Ribosomal RNA-processing protein 12 [Tetrabaena socialis]|uniref:Ribosomal RNA-processing protein 12 n=1 Tax=Tetrabaena socialis TaxID=47790 RepID=A0A2J7ZP29_9CHLO|nr:Ribosomal RNA-processing protein 12 [Tetrabaena socialis]|eukprot:PNH02025.1 Ribosomal RNA-processing protein 12 [Tetrabaena socialis]